MVLTPDELQGNLSRQKLHANMKPEQLWPLPTG